MSVRTALVIEDDATCSEMLELALLSVPELAVETVTSGSQARKRVLSGRPYALVITDFHLPGEDGLSLVESIRAMPGAENLPFILVTSARETDVRARAEALGARACFEKPFSPARLRDTVNSILNGS